MFLNMDQLEKQLDKEEFQEIGSTAAFKVLKTRFQMFIKSRIYLDDEYVVMTSNYFLQYTQLEILEFRDTLIQHMEYVKHLVDIESSGTESKEQDTSSRSGNNAHADDADIRPIYDEEPMAEVQTTAEINVFAIGQQHTEQPEFNYEGEVDQNAEQCHDTCPLSAKLTDNQTTELSNQSLESENICLKKTVAQFQKDFSRMEAHCVNVELKYQNQALKEGQHGQFLKVKRKPVLQPHKNQSVVNQPTAFKSERPRISKPRFASQVDVNNNLSKPVTTHYLPKERESAVTKPYHMIAPGLSRYSANDMVHNHYLEEAKKKTQESGRNSRPSVMPSARSQSTANGRKPKSRIHNQKSKNWPASKTSYVTTKTVQSNKTTNRNKPVEQTSVAKKPKRQIPKGHRFSIKKTSVVHEKTMTPRSCLRWKQTGKILKTVGLRWVPTGKIFTSSTTKVDNEPTNGSNKDITNQYKCERTLDVSAGTLNLSAGTSFNPKKEGLRVCSELGIHNHSNEQSSSKLVPKVVPSADKTAISRQELKLLFHHHITMLRSYALIWKPCQGDSLNLPDHRYSIYTVKWSYRTGDGDGDASFQLKSNSLPHAHAQTTKTYYKHRDSRIKKVQELKTKTSANFDIQDLPLRYQFYQGRLLASFQDDAK
ncbi:hypothetical protein Tco_0079063 [Tanacetum coccineum]